MKTVLAFTIVFLVIVFCNCGNSEVNSGNYTPQVETTGKKVAGVTLSGIDTLNNSGR
jgi:hypothetical protein